LILLITFSLFLGCSTQPYFNRSLTAYNVPPTEDEQIAVRLLLIGDAGNPSFVKQEPVLRELQKTAEQIPDKTLVMFLGDNIYPAGLSNFESPARKKEERKLNEQINVMKQSNARGIFLPGNHDWDKFGKDGWQKVKNQSAYIKSLSDPKIKFLPEDGCPGPEVIDIGGYLRIIILDTQWFLHKYEKPNENNSDCFPASVDLVIDSLDRSISSAGNKQVLIAAHHPLETFGSHGGYFSFRAHMFPLTYFNKYLWIPLPIIGSLYPLARNLGVTEQDMSSSYYKVMKSRIESLIKKHANIIYVSGHEHSLQVINGLNENLYLISGSGTSYHREYLTNSERLTFSDVKPGFMQLDYLKNGSIRIAVKVVNENDELHELFSMIK
jgi:hypothetical protein